MRPQGPGTGGDRCPAAAKSLEVRPCARSWTLNTLVPVRVEPLTPYPTPTPQMRKLRLSITRCVTYVQVHVMLGSLLLALVSIWGTGWASCSHCSSLQSCLPKMPVLYPHVPGAGDTGIGDAPIQSQFLSPWHMSPQADTVLSSHGILIPCDTHRVPPGLRCGSVLVHLRGFPNVSVLKKQKRLTLQLQKQHGANTVNRAEWLRCPWCRLQSLQTREKLQVCRAHRGQSQGFVGADPLAGF